MYYVHIWGIKKLLNPDIKINSDNVLTGINSNVVYLFLVNTEEYPSSAEGIGLENRQAGHTARGFESLFLLH